MLFYLKYGLLKGISRILCTLSYERILRIGKFLGPAIMNRIDKQKKRGLNQIMMGLKCSKPEAEKLLNEVYENVGMSAMEMLYMPRLCEDKENLSRYITIDHPEYLEAAYADNKGVVGLTAHVGSWEWLGAGLALYGYDTSAIGKKQKDDALMKIINEYRAKSGEHIFLSGAGGYEMIAAARAMKKNYILGFLSDKDGNKTGIPVRFMNRIFSFPQGPAVFARKFKAPILPIFIVRNKNKPGNTICIGKHFYYEETGDAEKDLLTNSQKMATIMETFIKENPADWLWFQHLFWTEADEIEMYRNLDGQQRQKLGLDFSTNNNGEVGHERE